MKQIEPPKTPTNWREQVICQLKRIPLHQWKANVIAYLQSVSWQQWGFVIIATFGYICYLFIAFWFGIFALIIGTGFSMMFRMEREQSAKDGGILYWIEWGITTCIRPLVPPSIRATMGKRIRSYQIVPLLIKGAFHLARPNRFTFALGCTVLALIAIDLVRQYFFPDSYGYQQEVAPSQLHNQYNTPETAPRLPETPPNDWPKQYKYPGTPQRVPIDYD
ncbi:MAG: hypothetical protein ACKO7W_02540 [Elainella sp.]